VSPLYTLLKDHLYALWRRVEEETGYLPLLRPVTPYAGPELLSPLTAIGVLIGLAVAAGVAIASLGALLVSLLVFHFLLTEVLGITVEIKPFAV
jgi:hypothetical protein